MKQSEPNKVNDMEYLKTKIVIGKSNEAEVIKKLKAFLSSNAKVKQIVDLGKEVENMRNLVNDEDYEMAEEDS
jgi:hypothetical protein